MDFGIAGRSALACASSKGLGRACAFSLAREGAAVTLVARGAEALEATVLAVCGAQAGFITGQNLLLDGGSYPGAF